MDAREYNREAWNAQVELKNRWTIPVDADEISRAKRGDWQVLLTPQIPVPRAWFPDLNGSDVLALASGGGQQAPIFAAAGARVTVLDNSDQQLAQDRFVAERDGLSLTTIQADMADLSAIRDGSVDLVFHPCSNCFCPDIRPVWIECARVLRPGGVLMVGFTTPAMFIFDGAALEEGTLVVRHSLPFSEVTDISADQRKAYMDKSDPLMFGHTLEDQVGAQLEAGFVLTALFEDRDPTNALSRHMATYIATRAVKLEVPSQINPRIVT